MFNKIKNNKEFNFYMPRIAIYRAVLITWLMSMMSFHVNSHENHLEFDVSTQWLDLANGAHKIGKSHGEIDIDQQGQFYISTMSDGNTKGGIRVYSPAGDYLHNVANAPDDFHGFVIRQDQNGQEYIYGTSLKYKQIIKMTLQGEIIFNIAADKTIPKQFQKIVKHKNAASKPTLKLTAIDVDQQGNLYVVDGYSLDYIHKYNEKGQYLTTFGGQGSPYYFNNCHKIHIDPRYTPNRLICTDRKNGRLVHMMLDGGLIGTYATDLRRPSSVAFYNDIAAVAEISGRVSLIDKGGKTIKTLGTNDIASEINTNVTEPDKWRVGVFTAPHGITFDHQGNLYITEWNKWGRLVRFDLQTLPKQ
ncbi:hypothetical protein [Algibacillus agarilyticus]|uniref:hypothetical protein n=1 Tax=Algibacillus agarilyticus TaxID=2234133 RepID=UPI000DD0B9B6|nr:hypothetical protein [Algibacillus agarilyticus]